MSTPPDPPRGSHKPPTILDVAALAGVSKSTVSNVIRGAGRVSDETRERVAVAVQRLGYRPNLIARQLVSRVTNTIGVLAGGLDNPFHGEMATRVVKEASRHGYTAIFLDIEDDAELTSAGVESLLRQHVAGIVFLAIFGSSPAIEYTLRGRVPVVFIGMREEWADSVAVDDHGGCRMATQHLIELGHECISFLTTPHVEQSTARSRAGGYRAAMRVAGLPARPLLRWDTKGDQVTIGQARGSLEAELSGARGSTAIVCSNDLGAIALLDFCDRLRIKVPERLSVVGFDDVYVAGLERIALTTVAQPHDDLARIGIETMVSRIQGRETGDVQHRSLPASLLVRRSSAPPPSSDMAL